MDSAQAFIFDAGWIFFAAWSLVLAALSVIAFKRDILPAGENRSQNAAIPMLGTGH